IDRRRGVELAPAVVVLAGREQEIGAARMVRQPVGAPESEQLGGEVGVIRLGDQPPGAPGGRLDGAAELLELGRSEDHSWPRIAQRSGKSGWKSVLRKYSAPADPPVPVLVPIVRSTIFTWR